MSNLQIQQATDHTSIQYEYVESCNNTEVIALYYRAMHELSDHGHAPGCAVFNYSQNAFIAKIDNKIIALMLFEDCAWRNSLVVILGYVIPMYRRTGIYTNLWNSLVAKATELNRAVIEGSTQLTNSVMLHVMDSHGRKPTSMNYEYRIPACTSNKEDTND